MLSAGRDWLQAAWASAVKDIRTALTERSTLVQSITLPVNYMIMMVLFVLAGAHDPVAVVMHDNGRYAQQFVAALARTHTFRLMIEDQAQARDQWRQGTLVAVITIPAGFGAAVSHGRPVQIPMAVNNLNEDLTHDAVWAARSAVRFYATSSPARSAWSRPSTTSTHATPATCRSWPTASS